jgi:2,3-bisphosphoglycerate-independent phosphoglycerate mutase
MKYCIIVPDGMADYPLSRLADRTPLEAARTPGMDAVAAEGTVGMARLVPSRMQPSSDVANLSLLGYNPKKYYTGRGPIEATSLGIRLGPHDIAFRCNLITADDEDRIEDYSAGEVPSKEAALLIDAVQKEFADRNVTFHAGISFRNIMVYGGTEEMTPTCFAPHDHMGELYEKYLPKGPGSKLIVEMILASRELLESHEINKVRIDLGENPANMIWPWSPGRMPQLERFEDRWGVKGAVICAVDLIKGLALLTGLDPVDVPGATGSYDTDYAAKAQYAIEALKDHDFVFVHVESPDTAGHAADIGEKVKAIENIDKLIVGPLHEALKQSGEYRLLVLPDHPTPIVKRTHTGDPVPFALCGSGVASDNDLPFCESSAGKTKLRFPKGHELIEHLFRG